MFPDFLVVVQNQTGSRLKTDNGTEFVNREFEYYFLA